MSLNTLTRFPVENMSINVNSIQLTLLFLGLVDFLLLCIFLDKKRMYSFFAGFSSSIQSHFTASRDHQSATRKGHVQLSAQNEESVDNSVCREDMELVLRSLGIFQEELPAKLDSNEIFNLFEEENPRMAEVKEAFDVFDKNRDGLIDAKELQSVLSSLGLREGLEIEKCRRMIGVFDENGDGKIDFNEYVKFMESSLC